MAKIVKKINQGSGYTRDGVGSAGKVVKVDEHLPSKDFIDKFTTEEDEGLTGSNMLIPRLTVLQGLSPQLDRSAPEYIEGARVGQFCDVALGEVWDDLLIVPAFYADIYLEWAPRESGKGLIRNFGTDSSAFDALKPNEKLHRYLPNGNEIVETGTIYCLNLNAKARMSFFPLSHALYQSAKQFNVLRGEDKIEAAPGVFRRVKMIFRSYRVTSRQKTFTGGKAYLPIFERAQTTLELDPSQGLYDAAERFSEQCKKGLVTLDIARDTDEPQNDGRM